MIRIILGAAAGFISWLIVWIVSEKLIGVAWPTFGVHQRAFEDVLKNGGEFTAETGPLLTHIALGSLVSLISGALAALAAGENSVAPLIAGCLLLVMGIAKAVMSWRYVPIWYHIVFTALLLPLAVGGGKLLPF